MREPTNEVEVERDAKVTVSDGTVLLADIYHPVGVNDAATIVERTPYGRANFSAGMGRELAARGYRYVLQACRGTDGSGGSHSYFAEAQDGRGYRRLDSRSSVVRRQPGHLRRAAIWVSPSGRWRPRSRPI